MLKSSQLRTGSSTTFEPGLKNHSPNHALDPKVDKFATYAYRLSTDVIQLTLTLKMTEAQVVEKSVTVNNRV